MKNLIKGSVMWDVRLLLLLPSLKKALKDFDLELKKTKATSTYTQKGSVSKGTTDRRS